MSNGGGPRDLYWAELVELRVACAYIRLYRDDLAMWMTRFASIRAIVSVSALGTWAAVKSYPLIWGGIIAAAQVADALQNAIPLAARMRGTSGLLVTLDVLFIDCVMEWEHIRAGGVVDSEIVTLRHKMMTRRHEAEVKNLSGVLPARPRLLRKAEAEADAYFRSRGQTGAVR